MFKKLKQKIEEGGEGGLDNVSFSPHKLPGSIIRSTYIEERGKSPQSDDLPEIQSPFVETSKWEQKKGEFPNHLNLKSHLDHLGVLEARVKELEQECSMLNIQLTEETDRHHTEQSGWEAKIVELDKRGMEMKMQVVELELEMAKKQEEFEESSKNFQEQLQNQKEAVDEQNAFHVKEINQLRAEINKKELEMISEENKYCALEKKAHHLESQLKAYESASENEVVNRLHSEVADVEQRVKSRNLEIQILERRLASQAKENEEQIEKLLNRQGELEMASKELAQVIQHEKAKTNELVRELEMQHQKNVELVREKEDLLIQISVNTQAQQKLAVQLEELQSSHTKQIQELDNILEDKEKSIKDLMNQLKHQGTTVLYPMCHPPGVARRTTSIGIQTVPNPPDVDNSPATLPVAYAKQLSLHEAAATGPATGPATMTSLSSDEALEVMREQQLRLEEDLSEKLKIIRVQQQKIMDIKKELRLQKHSTTSDGSASGNQPKRSPSPPLRVAIASDVNFQYLKHVVIKFMCSPEDEALQLIRAVSTLLEFTQQEEEHVRSYLNYKMSWFGAIPPPIFPPMQTIK